MLGEAVLHVPLSAAPGEGVSAELWKQIARSTCVAWDWKTTAPSHVPHRHRAFSRAAAGGLIRFDGGVTSDSHDYRRQESLRRPIEREHGHLLSGSNADGAIKRERQR